MAYLFLLMAVCCLPTTLVLRNHVIAALDENQAHLVKQIPDIQITNGRVIVDQHQPYYITRKDGSPAMIIDTTGSMNYIADPHVFALLMENALIVRSGKNSFKTIDLSSIKDFHLDSVAANNWLLMVKDTFAPVSYGIFLMTSYILLVMVMLVAAIFGLILSNVMHGSIGFAAALRIATVAVTPSLIIMTIAAAIGMDISEEICLAASLIYLVAGIKACANPLAPHEEEHVDLKSCLHDEIMIAQDAA